MRRTSSFVIIALVLLSTLACRFSINIRSVGGSGQLARETREVGAFDAISLSGIGALVIEQGGETELHIEAEDNLLRYLESEVEGNTLYLRVREGTNVIPTRGIRYEVTVTSLEEVAISGVGGVEIDDLETERLIVEVSGGGDVEIDELIADDLRVRISGLGSVKVEDGEVTTQEIAISGGGDYTARDLGSADAGIQISGLGKAIVRVSEALDVRISGGGTVQYIGSPSVRQEISGIGNIEQIGE